MSQKSHRSATRAQPGDGVKRAVVVKPGLFIQLLAVKLIRVIILPVVLHHIRLAPGQVAEVIRIDR